MSEWLELELAEQLAPVDPPDELWNRCIAPRRREVPQRRLWLAAAMVFVMAGGSLWLFGQRSARNDSRWLPAQTPPGSCILCHTTT